MLTQAKAPKAPNTNSDFCRTKGYQPAVILLDWGLIGAPVWIQSRCEFGLGLLIGGLEWILVDLTPGALDLYLIQTVAEEE